jgi:hypothetical protein
MAHKASDIPPVIERQRPSEQLRYMRIDPAAKVQMLLDLERTATFDLPDCRTLAYWSLKAEFGNERNERNELPHGVYGNPRGDWFTIDEWGHETPLQFSSGQIWDPIRVTVFHPGVIPHKLRFSLGRWLAPAQIFSMGELPFAVTAEIQMQQPPAGPAPRPTLSSPVAQEQFNRGAAPFFDDNAIQSELRFNYRPTPTPPAPNTRVPRVPAAERMRTAATAGVAEPAASRVMGQQRPIIPKPDEGPLSDVLAFNAQTDWPSEESRLRHAELNVSLVPPPTVSESTNALYEEGLSVFSDPPSIQYVPGVC